MLGPLSTSSGFRPSLARSLFVSVMDRTSPAPFSGIGEKEQDDGSRSLVAGLRDDDAGDWDRDRSLFRSLSRSLPDRLRASRSRSISRSRLDSYSACLEIWGGGGAVSSRTRSRSRSLSRSLRRSFSRSLIRSFSRSLSRSSRSLRRSFSRSRSRSFSRSRSLSRSRSRSRSLSLRSSRSRPESRSLSRLDDSLASLNLACACTCACTGTSTQSEPGNREHRLELSNHHSWRIVSTTSTLSHSQSASAAGYLKKRRNMEKRNGGFSTFGNGKVQHQDNCRAMGGPSIRISLFRRIPAYGNRP